MTTYSEKLKDPRWQKKRLKILERDKFKCQHCNDDKNTLNVHHKIYFNIEPWEYDDYLLITLCEKCHDKITSIKKILTNNILMGLFYAAPQLSELSLFQSIAGKSKKQFKDFFYGERTKTNKNNFSKFLSSVKKYWDV